MERIQYELQSYRGKIVEVPREYAEIAQEIVDKVVKGREMSDRVKPLVIESLFGNMGILSAYGRLAESVQFREKDASLPLSKDTLRYQDEVYLRICINLNEKRMRGPERDDAMSVDRGLIDAINSLN